MKRFSVDRGPIRILVSLPCPKIGSDSRNVHVTVMVGRGPNHQADQQEAPILFESSRSQTFVEQSK